MEGTKQNPRQVVTQARAAHEKRKDEARRIQDEVVRRHREAAMARDQLLKKLIPANASDYKKWLQGHLERGGKVTNTYDRSLPDNFYVAIDDLDSIPKLYGAQAISIIVPNGVRTPKLDDHMPYGHCNIYFMDDFSVHGLGSVPLYSDVNF